MRTIKISEILPDSIPIALGPMAGITDKAFRTICRQFGANLLFTEMVSAKGLTYHNKNTARLLETDKSERPIALQLFGSEPDVMAEAVMMTQDYPFSMIDINMGCPVPKVVNNGEGSALMLDPVRAAEIVKAMKKKTSKPISVKIRKGFYDDDDTGVDFAKRMEDAGADLLTVHGRTRMQGYSGKADWEHIKKVKQALTIPVIGSGDVTSAELACRMMEETKVDGIMIARAARGNPWIFGKISKGIELAEKYGSWSDIPECEKEILQKRTDIEEKKKMILHHARLLIDQDGEYAGMRKMRSHAGWYTLGEKGSSKLRARLFTINTYAELEEILY